MDINSEEIFKNRKSKEILMNHVIDLVKDVQNLLNDIKNLINSNDEKDNVSSLVMAQSLDQCLKDFDPKVRENLINLEKKGLIELRKDH